MSDDEIAAALEPLRPISYRKVPIEGRWLEEPPFPDRTAGGRRLTELCTDPGVSTLAVDRATGEVWLVAPDGTLDLVNGSLAALVTCSTAYQKARRKVAREDADDALEAIAAQARSEFEGLDPAAVRDENQAWSVALEELEYGI